MLLIVPVVSLMVGYAGFLAGGQIVGLLAVFAAAGLAFRFCVARGWD